jgi:predicted nucleotidyltransferase
MTVVGPEALAEAVRRLREALDPQRIVRFGSYATGQATNDSDLDLLIVAETGLGPVESFGLVNRLLRDLAVGVDAIVRTPAEYQRQRGLLNHVVYFADRYGRVLYER